MKIQIGSGKLREGWTGLANYDSLDGLPFTEPIERIYVPNILRLTEPELLGTVLESWWNSPQVSVKTLMVTTGHMGDSPDMIRLIRPAGWGIVCPYRTSLLSLDGWPIDLDMADDPDLVASLCRAIKTTAHTQPAPPEE